MDSPTTTNLDICPLTVERISAPKIRPRSGYFRRISRWIGRRLPQGLYARSLIIIIAPMVLLQTVLTFVFMERHWQTVTERLSKSVVADIAAIIDVIETFPQDPEYEEIVRLAREKLALNVAILPPDPFPPPSPKPFFSVLDDALRAEIARQINRPFWIDTVGDSQLLEIRIRLENRNNVMRIFARRNSAYASNSHIFLVWMIGASLVLLAIAVLFLRNQIRPIQLLAEAAEQFGKGQRAPPEFRLRGAREVRQASLAFMEMRERIERQMEQRTDMLTGVSHDLRTILTRFKLQLELAGDGDEVDALKKDVVDMQRMLQGYLDFARGQSEEQTAKLNIRPVFDRFQADAELLDKQLTVHCNEDMNVHVRPEGFSRMVANLVANGLRYAHAVEINAKISDYRLTIEIDDDGSGVPEDMREEVFKPFTRLDEARNIDESGTGLGLSIARDIARSHGGDITLTDSPLGGLRATVTLPI